VSAPDDGGPAFPSQWTNDDGMNATAPDGQLVPPGGTVPLIGMSLRDYLAAAALQGYIAAHSGENVKFPSAHVAADQAYEYADAMLEARRK
jgi:hypothetical protein